MSTANYLKGKPVVSIRVAGNRSYIWNVTKHIQQSFLKTDSHYSAYQLGGSEIWTQNTSTTLLQKAFVVENNLQESSVK